MKASSWIVLIQVHRRSGILAPFGNGAVQKEVTPPRRDGSSRSLPSDQEEEPAEPTQTRTGLPILHERCRCGFVPSEGGTESD